MGVHLRQRRFYIVQNYGSPLYAPFRNAACWFLSFYSLTGTLNA